MQVLTEKIEWVLAMILDSVEPERADTRTLQADECEEAKNLELNIDTHHTLIEPCW